MSNLNTFLSNSFSFPLTGSQVEASKRLDQFFSGDKNCFILKGYAGTGKTTLLDGISRYLASKHQNFKLMAPTGRAAKIIADKTGCESFTIHKSIYSMDDLKEYKETQEDGSETFKYYFGLKESDDTVNTVYIVDEASMLSNHYSEGEFFRFGSGFLLNDFLRYCDFNTPNIKRKILFIGDNAQLPPVNMNFSPALDEKYLSDNFSNLKIDQVELTDVARQKKGSGILINATSIRSQISEDRFNKIKIETNYEDINPIRHEEIANKYLGCLSKSNDNGIVIIAYSNKSVQHYNDLIRSHLFPNQKTIQPEDKFLVVRNNYNYGNGVLNGEFGTIKNIYSGTEIERVGLRKKKENIQVELKFRNVCVELMDLKGEKVSFDCKIIENQLDSKEPQLTSDEQRALYVLFKRNNPYLKAGTPEFKEAIKTDVYFNALQVKYGYAVTCHKAQGGEWDNCIVDFSPTNGFFNKSYFRWSYTALTRCKNNLYSLNTPDQGVADNLKIIANNLSSSDSSEASTIPETRLTDVPENLSFENEFQLSLYQKVLTLIKSNVTISEINHNQYAERYLFDAEVEKTTVDFLYNKSGKITSVRPIILGTDGEKIMDLLKPITGVVVSSSKHESNKGVIAFGDDEKHLEEFYDDIKEKITQIDVDILNVEHNQYHEKYHFKKGNEVAVFLFYYDGKKRFKKVIPEITPTSSQNLINEIGKLL